MLELSVRKFEAPPSDRGGSLPGCGAVVLDPGRLHPPLDIENVLHRAPDLRISQEYIRTLEEEMPMVFGLLLQAGVHPIHREPFRNPFTKDWDTENFTNTGKHNCLVGLGSRILAEPFVDSGIFEQASLSDIQRFGTLHDANKRLQVLAAKAGRAEILDLPDRDHFRQLELPPQLTDFLLNFDNPSGGENIFKFLYSTPAGVRAVPQDLLEMAARGDLAGLADRQVDIERLLVRTMDDMLYTTFGAEPQNHVLTGWERLEACHQRSWYPRIWAEGFGEGDNGIVHIPSLKAAPSGVRPIGSIASLQAYMANTTCQLVKAFIDPADPLPAEYFIKDFLTARIKAELMLR